VTLLQACIAVLFLYVAILMGVGLWSARRTQSASDFILGGRSIGPWVTALSYIAVYFSSVLIIGGGAFGYKYGMATIWIGAINVLVGCLLCWIVLGKRVREMTERYGVRTMSGFFARRFNSPAAGIYSAAVVFLFLIIYNVSVVKGMANAFQVLMDLPYWGGVLISGLVIIFYVVLGGYMAVVWTSFIQAWVMIFALLLLMFKTFGAVGGLGAGMQKLAAIGPRYVETPGVWGWAGLFSFALVVSLGVWGMPQMIIRFYSIKDTKTLRLGTVIVTVGATIAVIPYLVGAHPRPRACRPRDPEARGDGALAVAGGAAAGRRGRGGDVDVRRRSHHHIELGHHRYLRARPQAEALGREGGIREPRRERRRRARFARDRAQAAGPHPRPHRLRVGGHREHEPLAPHLRALLERREQGGRDRLDGGGLPHRDRLDVAQEAFRHRRIHHGFAREPRDAAGGHRGGAPHPVAPPDLIERSESRHRRSLPCVDGSCFSRYRSYRSLPP
jgi:hypothetical protein